MIRQIQDLIKPLLPLDAKLVAAAFKKDGAGVVVLVHGTDPERWIVGTWAEGLGWLSSYQTGPDVTAMNEACGRFVALAAGFVREYPSFYVEAPLYRSVPE